MDDIAHRLRVLYCAADNVTPCGTCLTCQAADEIERLRVEAADILASIPLLIRGSTAGRDAEIARLRGELADWQRTVRAHESERDELAGEVQRLTGLLDRAYRLAVGHGPDFSVFDTWEDAIGAYEEQRRG